MMATKVLTDRVAVVSASTKGIGFAIAKRLGADGASVVVSSRKPKNVEEAVTALRLEGIDASGITAHVGLKEDRNRLIDFAISQYGKLDILVSNAAANPHFGDIMSISDSQWDKLLTVNVSFQVEWAVTNSLTQMGTVLTFAVIWWFDLCLLYQRFAVQQFFFFACAEECELECNLLSAPVLYTRNGGNEQLRLLRKSNLTNL
ncbi:hypothetical protein Y032_0138g2064 [Ancylostoma ceylanicum]|nr:hypothetical protein Y032_0138g2064 [Ancylostoma ceylanicum]